MYSEEYLELTDRYYLRYVKFVDDDVPAEKPASRNAIHFYSIIVLTHAIMEDLGYSFEEERFKLSKHNIFWSLQDTVAEIVNRLGEERIFEGETLRECVEMTVADFINQFIFELKEATGIGLEEEESEEDEVVSISD